MKTNTTIGAVATPMPPPKYFEDLLRRESLERVSSLIDSLEVAVEIIRQDSSCTHRAERWHKQAVADIQALRREVQELSA